MSYPPHEEDEMSGTTRIHAAEITGPKGRLIKRFARKTLGTVPTSIGVYWHHQQVLMDMASVGRKVQISARVVAHGAGPYRWLDGQAG